MASSVGSTSSTGMFSATSALFQASGIASGINTASIVDSLITAQSGPLNQLRQRQEDYKVQISTAGTLITQLKELQTVAANLASKGVAAIRPTETYADFTVSGSAKTESSYAISVEQVAKQAKMRSASFTSAQDESVVPDGTLQFAIDGANTASIDTTGKTLADIAESINQGISQLSASVISTSTGYYLNVSRRETGYSKTTGQDAALTVVSDPGLGLALTQSAENARLTIDGLSVERTSNTISDVLDGVTFQLTGESGVEKDVAFVADSSGTEEALNTFVTAYNALAQTIKSQLVLDPDASYGDTLLGHSSMTSIQRAMQGMLSQVVSGTGSVRILADLGLELQRDGSLSLNVFAMQNAVSKNPGAVNAIFSTANTGIAAVVKRLADAQTRPLTGALSMQQRSLQSQILDMDERAIQMERNLDGERRRLVAQFTAMEQLIAGFTSAATYLAQVANLKISE